MRKKSMKRITRKKRTNRKITNKKRTNTKRSNRKRSKKSTKSNNDLKRFKTLQKKLEKLFMNNASYKEIDETSRKLANLQKKMIKVQKNIK